MKSGLAAIVGAVRGLRRLGLTPRARVQLQSVVEEECTGNGALACVLAGHTADAAILTEPTRGAIWNAQVGVLWFQVHVAGLPAHAGDAPVGANAIEASIRAIEALRALEAELNAVKPPLYAAYPHPINLNVGVIRGGDWPSTVAGECVTHFRLALYPGERVEALKQRVEATVAAAAPSGYSVRGRLRGLRVRGLRAGRGRAAGRRPARRRRAHDRPPPAAVRVDGDDRRAQLPALRRHPGRLLRPGRRARARRRRARPCALRDTRPLRRSRCSSATGAGSRRANCAARDGDTFGASRPVRGHPGMPAERVRSPVRNHTGGELHEMLLSGER